MRAVIALLVSVHTHIVSWSGNFLFVLKINLRVGIPGRSKMSHQCRKNVTRTPPKKGYVYAHVNVFYSGEQDTAFFCNSHDKIKIKYIRSFSRFDTLYWKNRFIINYPGVSRTFSKVNVINDVNIDIRYSCVWIIWMEIFKLPSSYSEFISMKSIIN